MPGALYTKAQERLIRKLFQQGKTDEQIAKALKKAGRPDAEASKVANHRSSMRLLRRASKGLKAERPKKKAASKKRTVAVGRISANSNGQTTIEVRAGENLVLFGTDASFGEAVAAIAQVIELR